MDTWTLQMGFPVVEVRRDYDKRSAQLTQVRPVPNGRYTYIGRFTHVFKID